MKTLPYYEPGKISIREQSLVDDQVQKPENQTDNQRMICNTCLRNIHHRFDRFSCDHELAK